MLTSYDLLKLAGGINRLRQWIYNPINPANSRAHLMPTDEGTERMIALDCDLLRVETLLEEVADGEVLAFGLAAQVKGILIPAVRS